MFISGELTDAEARVLCLRTDYWKYEQKEEEDHPFHLNLNCTGGPPYLTLSAVTGLVEYPGALYTYAHGYCLGAGVLLLACGQVRAAHPVTRFLVRGMPIPPVYLEPTAEEVAEGAIPGPSREADWYNAWHDNFLKGRTREPAETWQWLRESGQSWFGVDYAMKVGLIHEVRGWRTEDVGRPHN